MTKVFVDTDVCIDLLSGRKPFNKTAEILFSMADNGKIKIYVSSLSFANIDYVLRSQYSTTHSRQIIAKFKTLVNVLPVDSKTEHYYRTYYFRNNCYTNFDCFVILKLTKTSVATIYHLDNFIY